MTKSYQTEPASRYGLSAILSAWSLARLSLIGAVVALLILGFAWAAGWLSPGRLDQRRLIDTFETVNGVHPGFRRNHAKGLCLSGYFDSNGAGARLSRATVFAPGRTVVFGRFALAGGMPRMPDSPAAVRSMALNLALRDGEVWRTGMNDIPVFPVRDARAFRDQLIAARPDPRTGKPDPSALSAFFEAHRESARAAALIKAQPVTSGFANARYNSLDAFYLVNAQGTVVPVRWSMVPEDAFEPEPAVTPQDENYLFDALIQRLRRGPVRWHLVLVLGRSGDATNDATVPWPAGREQIDAGTLAVTAVQSEAAGNCRDINFDPLVLPSGIAPSDDPLLSARSAAYSVSFRRRAGEPKSPSAVQVREER